jgi:hypothetical protein
MNEIQELEEIYCEMHKDVYGVKARWIKFDSVEEGRAALDQLGEALKAEMASQAAHEAQAVATFEARVESLILMGAGSRADALRWLHDSCNTQGDDDFLCYELGLPYGYLRRS